MQSTFTKKNETIQCATENIASSILDSSSQSESLQRKADMANNATQRAEAPRPNNTGMPDNLKSGIESLSGFSMDDVRVHYNSSKPATVQALAYTQGTDIHVAPGQEKCLPHEAWHVAQQMAGRVSPTMNINGMPVNDNAALEHEADVMGEKAVQCKKNCALVKKNTLANVLQGKFYVKCRTRDGFRYEVHDEIDDPDSECYRFAGEFCNSYPVYEKNILVHNIFYQENNPSNPHIRGDAISRGIHYGKKKNEIFYVKTITENCTIEKDEDVLIVSHGSRPFFFLDSKFSDYSARELAAKMIGKLPNGYRGGIYLDGCHTGEPRKELDDGTSFAERFGNHLKKMAEEQHKHMRFSVKGNLGASSTDRREESYGTEIIELDKKSKRLIKANIRKNIEKYLNETNQNRVGNIKKFWSSIEEARNILNKINKKYGQGGLSDLCSRVIEIYGINKFDTKEVLFYMEFEDGVVSNWMDQNIDEAVNTIYENKIDNTYEKAYFKGKFGKRIYSFSTSL